MHIRIFNDTVTIYHKTVTTTTVAGVTAETESWTRTVVAGVQWSDHCDKQNNDGKISVARYASVTFPEGTYTGLTLDPRNEEDVIVYGEVSDSITGASGHRVSDVLAAHTRSGRIKAVNDNTNRLRLKNIKVTLG